MASPTVISGKRPLAILSANVQGLCPTKGKHKLKLLEERCKYDNYLIISLTESHLNDNYHDGEIAIDGYNAYRADRTTGIRKGGVIVYVRSDLLPGLSVIAAGSCGNIEYVVLGIKILKIIHITIYRPPTAETIDFNRVINEIRSKIDVNHQCMPNVTFTGDLNFPDLDWSIMKVTGGSKSLKDQGNTLLTFFEDFFIEQYVHTPTRVSNILDIFATNDHDLISRIIVEDTNISDHRLVLIKTAIIDNATKDNEREYRNILSCLNFFSPKVCWNQIKVELGQVQWSGILENNTPDRVYSLILDVITDICLKYVPKKQTRNIKQIPHDRKIIMRKRTKLNKILEKSCNPEQLISIKEKLKNLELKLIESHKNEAAKNEDAAVEKIHSNPKFFFKYARSMSMVNTPVGPFHLNDSIVSSSKEMCEILQQQFESVYSIPRNDANIDEIIQTDGPRCLEDIDFNENSIKNSILEISASAAAGPDGLPAILLRNCVEELKAPLYHFWRLSLDTGCIPPNLKLSNVIPIYKGGDRCSPENYRPISLTSHVSKMFEKVVTKALTKYLESTDLFNQSQHGFRQGRSCLSQLLEHQQKILHALEQNMAVDVVYLDFAKAFDKVDYGILINKLKVIGVTGLLLRWIHCFLTGRKQVVNVDGEQSEKAPVHSGVPQGSVLGPLLFLIHISDIDGDLNHVSASSFADDTRVIMVLEHPEDCSKMQDDLNKVYDWADENNMQFNGKKFELIRYGKLPDEITDKYITRTGVEIGEVQKLKDLGVIMQNTATFESEIEYTRLKSVKLAGWVLRVFRTRDKVAMLTLYKTMVLPNLEYCCQLWSPLAMGMIRKLEAVQRSFTARIYGVSSLDYWSRLKSLKLYSLERRRERYLIIYVFKIIHKLVPNYKMQRYSIKTCITNRRGRLCIIPPLNMQTSAKIRTMIETSFAVRGPKLFNSITDDLRNYNGTVLSFKNKLDKFLARIPDQPCLPDYPQPVTSNSIPDQLAHMRACGIFL